jgi:hypothetical protein
MGVEYRLGFFIFILWFVNRLVDFFYIFKMKTVLTVGTEPRTFKMIVFTVGIKPRTFRIIAFCRKGVSK